MHDKKHVTNCNNVGCANLLSSVKSHCHEEFHGQIWLQIKTSPHLIGGKKYVGNEHYSFSSTSRAGLQDIVDVKSLTYYQTNINAQEINFLGTQQKTREAKPPQQNSGCL